MHRRITAYEMQVFRLAYHRLTPPSQSTKYLFTLTLYHRHFARRLVCTPAKYRCLLPLQMYFCKSIPAYLTILTSVAASPKTQIIFCISRCGSLFLISASCHARFVFRTLSCASCALQSAFFSLRLFFEFFSPAMGFGSSLTAAGPHGILTRFPLSSPMLAVYAPKTLQSYDSITLQTQNPIGPQYLKTIKTA